MKKLYKISFFLSLLICLTSCSLVMNIIQKVTHKKIYTLSDKEDIFTLGDVDTIYDKYKNAGDICIADSKSTMNILIIPVKFNGSTESVKKSTIEEAFFGNPKENSNILFESLKSYYEKSSYGNLTINGTVADYVQLSKTASQYERLEDCSKEMTLEAMDKVDPIYNFKNYDNNHDGVIDGIYILYDKQISSNNSIWWAHTGWVYDKYYDDVQLKPYVWAATSFIYYESALYPFTRPNPSYNNTIQYSGKIDSTVFIHETGHLLGADDYYDYDSSKGSNYGVGPDDMMSNNFGDHNPLTKTLFGWIKPQVITRGEHTITLNKFSSSGDAIILNASYNDEDSVYDEFFIVDFYGNDNLDADTNSYMASKAKGLTTPGIRIYHVNSTITDKTGINTGSYTTIFDCDNSDEDLSFITLVNASKSTFTSTSVSTISNNYLYKKNDIFDANALTDINSLSKTSQIVNTYNRYWKLEVIDMNSDTAKVKITYNK